MDSIIRHTLTIKLCLIPNIVHSLYNNVKVINMGGEDVRELDDIRYKAIGSRIREVRIERNISQADLAEKAHISVPHMSEIENGKSKLRLSTFVYITEALQISADALLRLDTPEVNAIYQNEFKELLSDCSPTEIDSIVKIVKELKTTMRVKKNDYPF